MIQLMYYVLGATLDTTFWCAERLGVDDVADNAGAAYWALYYRAKRHGYEA